MSTAAILEGLNDSQREAVLHVDGPLLILAGPGSGKTRVVTHRIANLLEQGVSPFNILALTFTNKAAEEMRSRLRKLVGEDAVWMGTFHGYCARFLRRYSRLVGLPENYSIYDPSDAKMALKVAIDEAKVSLTHLNIDQIAREIGRWKNRLVTPEALLAEARTSLQHTVGKVYPVYQQVLLRNGAVDFDDLLLHTAVTLRGNPELRAELDERHKYILVDEYQDTNMAQYVMVRALSIDHPNLNVTGDPDQSIYGWRGASIENILKFEKDYPNVHVVRLENNYRSTPQILSIADCLIQHNHQRKAKSLIPTREDGEQIRLCVYPSDRDEANDIARQIVHAVVDEGKRASDFAILYRTNAQSRLLEQALMAHRLNYQLIGGFRFYQRQEIKDLLAYLILVHNPTDDVAFRRVINAPTRGIGDKTVNEIAELATARSISMLPALHAMLALGKLRGRAATGAKQFLAIYEQLVSLSTGPLTDLIRLLLKETNYIEYLSSKKTDKADESVAENINELIADTEHIDETFTEGNRLEHFLEQVALLSDTDKLELSSDRVTLMTLHSAKGLEFDNVYIIAVEEDVLPHARSREDPKQMEEERRLLFVGITRAKQNLQLSFAKYRGFMHRMSVPSSFLMELPRSELKWIDQAAGISEFEDNNDWEFSQTQRSKPGKSPFADMDQVDFDDECQLPPDEIAAKLKNLVRERKNQVKTRVQTASDLISDSSAMAFQVGSIIEHPTYGKGRIIELDGRGLKRIARIQFADDTQVRAFHLSKANIVLADSASESF